VGVLRAVDAEIAAGMAVAGFISYEAAAGIDAAFCVYEAGAFPLVWFGVYREPQMLAELPEVPDNVVVSESGASVDAADYADSIERIKSYIAAGDTYEVNYTFRQRHAFSGDAFAFFRRLYYAQETDYAAYVDIGDYAVCSVSPELFFELRGSDIRMKPMKGTARRELTLEDDHKQAGLLRECGKNRAENVMIVDMVRNDLGRIAEPGSVRAASLFDVERYPAVWQMVSTVEARTGAGLSELMGALFPCASITGAPKVRTMEIIRELESSPRGIYTGAIGYWLPERQACFNVAIRTAVVDRKSAGMEYGVGGGIVWDSVEEHEFDE
jgi:para-aminobenzoate synthetase/4-amino-4-deoxychorismate lyase